MDEQLFRVGEGLYTVMQKAHIQQKLLQKKKSRYPFTFLFFIISVPSQIAIT